MMIPAEQTNEFALKSFDWAQNQFSYAGNMNEVAAALVKARAKIEVIHFNSKMVVGKANGKNVYKGYATIDQLNEQCHPILAEFGLTVSFHCFNDTIIARLLHESGQCICSSVPLPKANNDKDHWGNITSGRRYALMCLLNLSVAGEDDAAARPTTLGNQSANNNGQSNNGKSNGHEQAIEDRLAKVRNAFGEVMGKSVTDQEIQEMAGVSLRDITHEHIDKLQGVYRDLRAAAQQATETVGA